MKIILVAGSSRSGKTSIVNKITRNYPPNSSVEVIHMDRFYKSLSRRQQRDAKKNLYNFDHPNAIEWDLFKKTVEDLINGKKVLLPTYNYVTHSRTSNVLELDGSKIDVIIIEGIFGLYDSELNNLASLKIFVDVDPDVCLSRRILRDVKERGRSSSEVVNQYLKFVKPSFEDCIIHTKRYADIIIPRGAENQPAMSMLLTFLQSGLKH